MAGTYEDFTKKAVQSGLLSGFSQEDMALSKTNPEFGLGLLKLRQDGKGAKTTEQKLLAKEAENQLRESYAAGTTTGTAAATAAGTAGTTAAGTGTTAAATAAGTAGTTAAGTGTTAAGTANYGGYSYEKQDQYDELFNKAVNYEAFSYDPEQDERFGSYKKNYLREADRAREDMLAKMGAMTGGTPSSWAVSVADQAGNYYLSQLNDAIPALYEDAFDQHLQEYNANLNAYAAMKGERDFDYNAYLKETETQEKKKQQDWANALQLYNMGIDTAEIRKILGIPEPENTGVAYTEEAAVTGTGGKAAGNGKTAAANGEKANGSLLDLDVTVPKGNYFGGGGSKNRTNQRLH